MSCGTYFRLLDPPDDSAEFFARARELDGPGRQVMAINPHAGTCFVSCGSEAILSALQSEAGNLRIILCTARPSYHE